MAARPAFKVKVEGVGSVPAWNQPDQQLINAGTVSMFVHGGFRAVEKRDVGGRAHVVMQKRVVRRG